MISAKRDYIDVVITGEFVVNLWESMQFVIDSKTIQVEILSPRSIFQNTEPFPLSLDKVAPAKMEGLPFEEQILATCGMHGQLQVLPSYAWTFLDKLSSSFKSHEDFPPPVKLLELKPPKDGKPWDSTLHQMQYEIVEAAFNYFVGVNRQNVFKLQKIILLDNPSLEQKFLTTYNKFREQQRDKDFSEMKFQAWRSAILNKVSDIFHGTK